MTDDAHGSEPPVDAAAPGAQVSPRWAAWRAEVDLREYETRWDRLEADGAAPHGEADLVASWGPRRVLDAGCGMGRVAIELDRRGIDVVGADLDPDLLEVARRHAPTIPWLLADLARDPLDGPYDLILLAGNVLVFCRPSDRGPIIANLAAHLAPGGRIVAGFATERSDDDPGTTSGTEPPLTEPPLTAALVEHHASTAGLVTEARWSTWERGPWTPADSYAVVVVADPRSASRAAIPGISQA